MLALLVAGGSAWGQGVPASSQVLPPEIAPPAAPGRIALPQVSAGALTDNRYIILLLANAVLLAVGCFLGPIASAFWCRYAGDPEPPAEQNCAAVGSYLTVTAR